MNLDDFIFSDSVSTPAGLSPSPEFRGKEAKSSNAVASAIPIKMRKDNAPTFMPQSVPASQHALRNSDEFNYVQRHVRKTSIDERRVSSFSFGLSNLCLLCATMCANYSSAPPEKTGRLLPSYLCEQWAADV